MFIKAVHKTIKHHGPYPMSYSQNLMSRIRFCGKAMFDVLVVLPTFMRNFLWDHKRLYKIILSQLF